MSKRRKAKPSFHVKRSNMKRPCLSGKSGFRYKGEAAAADHFQRLQPYKCGLCGKWHLGNKLTRRQRQAWARSGRE